MPKSSENVISGTDRISYSEDVKVNIGDFESRGIHITYSTDVKEGESPEGAIKRARSKVRKSLTRYEGRIRKATREHVDFDTMARLYRED